MKIEIKMEMTDLSFELQGIEKEDEMFDELCKQIKEKTNVNYDERAELEEYLKREVVDLDDIKETDDRYQRYLRGIQIWKQGRKNFEYIRDDIESYLKLPSTMKYFDQKRKLMNKIDIELMGVLLNKK